MYLSPESVRCPRCKAAVEVPVVADTMAAHGAEFRIDVHPAQVTHTCPDGGVVHIGDKDALSAIPRQGRAALSTVQPMVDPYRQAAEKRR